MYGVLQMLLKHFRVQVSFSMSVVWLDPGKKIPTVKAGFELRIFRSRGGRLNH